MAGRSQRAPGLLPGVLQARSAVALRPRPAAQFHQDGVMIVGNS
jgi:hypothetical protein